MQLYLTDQQNNFDKHLQNFIGQPVMSYSRQKLREQVTTIALGAQSINDASTDILFQYKIFPKHIMACKMQWEAEGRSMQAGDTILQQVYIPPVRGLSFKLIFGVRIHSIIHDATRTGFSYETLQGHVERGISTFTFEQTNGGQLIFKIHTFSEPGNPFTKLVAPLFALPYQAYCTREALRNVRRQLDI
jgi:uncharacterized protein (UPF0548 family)